VDYYYDNRLNYQKKYLRDRDYVASIEDAIDDGTLKIYFLEKLVDLEYLSIIQDRIVATRKVKNVPPYVFLMIWKRSW